MQGRAFIKLARQLLKGGSEVHRRSAAGGAFYGLMHECRDALYRWACRRRQGKTCIHLSVCDLSTLPIPI